MKITVTNSDSGSEPEIFGSLEALKEELQFSADADYAGKVLDRIKAGETRFTIANGSDTETYEIEA